MLHVPSKLFLNFHIAGANVMLEDEDPEHWVFPPLELVMIPLIVPFIVENI